MEEWCAFWQSLPADEKVDSYITITLEWCERMLAEPHRYGSVMEVLNTILNRRGLTKQQQRLIEDMKIRLTDGLVRYVQSLKSGSS